MDAVGFTIDDAVNALQQRVSPPLFFGHLRIIVVSEAVARLGMQNLNDYFRRNPEVRRLNWMFICKQEASDIMFASPQLERVPSLYLMTTMDQAVKMGRFPNDFLGVFWNASSSKGREGFLPYVELKKEQNIQISGMAYFRGEKISRHLQTYRGSAIHGNHGPQSGRRAIVRESAGHQGLLHVSSQKPEINEESTDLKREARHERHDFPGRQPAE